MLPLKKCSSNQLTRDEDILIKKINFTYHQLRQLQYAGQCNQSKRLILHHRGLLMLPHACQSVRSTTAMWTESKIAGK